MQPVGEVQEAVVHRDHEVGDQPRDRERPALLLDALDRDHVVGAVGAVLAVEAPHRARQRGADEALVGVGVVQPAHLQRHQPRLAQLDRLLQRALAQVPEVHAAAVVALADVLGVEPRLVGAGRAELRGGEDVLARLVPEVVVEGRVRAAVLPAALDLERLRVDHREAAGAVAVGVAEHADDDVLARHAVDGVRAGQARLLDELLGLDDRLEPWLAGVARPHRRCGSARSGSRARSGATGRAHGRRSCSGSSRSGAARRRRWASAARGRCCRSRRPRPPGSPACRRPCPRAGTRRTGTPRRGRAWPPRARRRRKGRCRSWPGSSGWLVR